GQCDSRRRRCIGGRRSAGLSVWNSAHASRTSGCGETDAVETGPLQSVNTNLEQISDWLTKILVGVGLTQFGSLRGNYASKSPGDDDLEAFFEDPEFKALLAKG